jgi:YebC/PmpR family DNA-binding regulatory protein
MPTDNIKRAIQKGTGEIPGVTYEEITYEGYAPGGVGIIVEVTTDNKNRAAAEVRQAFNDHGGNMAQTGAVSHSFQRKGQFFISASQIPEDQLMEVALEAGADDILNHGDHFEVLCPVPAYDALAKALQEKSIKPESSEIAYVTSIPVPVQEAETAKKVLELIEALEALDDVKAVHGNHEIDPKFLE